MAEKNAKNKGKVEGMRDDGSKVLLSREMQVFCPMFCFWNGISHINRSVGFQSSGSFVHDDVEM